MDISNPRVTSYINNLYKPLTEQLGQLREQSEERLIPIILRDTETFIMNILRMKKPDRILEIGTAVGYSASCMAQVLPGCHITTIEVSEATAEEARNNIKRLGYHDRIEVLCGPAQEILEQLEPAYDFVFIDAAKSHYRTFWDKSVNVCSRNAVIICDNIFMKGKTVMDRMEIVRRYRTSHGKMRLFLEYITETEDADTSLLPIGDGIAFSVLKGHDE